MLEAAQEMLKPCAEPNKTWPKARNDLENASATPALGHSQLVKICVQTTPNYSASAAHLEQKRSHFPVYPASPVWAGLSSSLSCQNPISRANSNSICLWGVPESLQSKLIIPAILGFCLCSCTLQNLLHSGVSSAGVRPSCESWSPGNISNTHPLSLLSAPHKSLCWWLVWIYFG